MTHMVKESRQRTYFGTSYGYLSMLLFGDIVCFLTGAMSFSTTGILITLFVAGVFVRHNDTPVVKAAGRELSYVLLIGIFLCYSVTFALVLRPTNIVCGLQR